MQKWDRSQRLSASGKALASDAEYMPIDGCQRINEFMGWWAFKKAEPGSRHFARIGLTQDEENEELRQQTLANTTKKWEMLATHSKNKDGAQVTIGYVQLLGVMTMTCMKPIFVCMCVNVFRFLEEELVRWCCKHNSDELEVVWNDAILTEQNKLADGEILKKKR